jgi:hypothetical protein
MNPLTRSSRMGGRPPGLCCFAQLHSAEATTFPRFISSAVSGSERNRKLSMNRSLVAQNCILPYRRISFCRGRILLTGSRSQCMMLESLKLSMNGLKRTLISKHLRISAFSLCPSYYYPEKSCFFSNIFFVFFVSFCSFFCDFVFFVISWFPSLRSLLSPVKCLFGCGSAALCLRGLTSGSWSQCMRLGERRLSMNHELAFSGPLRISRQRLECGASPRFRTISRLTNRLPYERGDTVFGSGITEKLTVRLHLA